MDASGSAGEIHRFGGDWTAAKLAVLAGYLKSYTTALKNQPFRKAYIDAFAGSGVWTHRDDDESTISQTFSQTLLFPELNETEPQELLDGSAQIALKTEPHFDTYIFIERSAKRCDQLEELKQQFSHLAARIRIQCGDANQAIQQLCRKKWRSSRAVLFLDPYGLQVNWDTVEAVAATQAIDMWLLFPLGVGVNRMLTRSGVIPDEWRECLNALFGTEDWYDEFYRVEKHYTLFGPEERLVKTTTESIGRYFNDRLKSVFAGVASDPGVLKNSTNCPLYLLCFAVGNRRGIGPALRIANHLLKELR